jgi:hypothetical protein
LTVKSVITRHGISHADSATMPEFTGNAEQSSDRIP